MKQEVTRFIKKHHLLEPHKTVLVGVSGGPDSMALLHYLKKLREDLNLKLIVLTIDHQLRGRTSIEDSDYVEAMCLKWNIQCDRTALDVSAHKKEHQVSTQVASREKRYHFFEEKMIEYQADYLALGHHGDDQAETMIMRFVRSATSNALSGIPEKRSFATGFIIRPLLSVTKATIVDYCETHGIHPRIDPSNEDTSYTRNFYRKRLMPLIKQENSNIHATMQHLSESFAADECFLKSEAVKMEQGVVHYNQEKSQASFEIKVFKSYPLSLQRRCYHLVLECLYSNLPENISYVHEGIFFNLLEDSQRNSQVDFPSDLIIEKSYDHIEFSFKKEIDDDDFKKVLDIPGELKLPDGEVIKAFCTNRVSDQGKYSFICDVNKHSLPLHVRTRKPGDRMKWKGLSGSKKLKDVFIDLKIPRAARDNWPIVTDNNGDILWLVGLRKNNQGNNGKDSVRIQLEYGKKNG